MTDTPLDLDAILARAAALVAFPGDSTAAAFEAFTLARTDVPALVAALRDAQAEVEREHALAEQRKDLLLLLGDHVDAVVVGEFGIQLALAEARAEKAEAQVAAVLALCDEWEAGPWSWLKDTAAPRVRAAVDGAGADVPMSPNTGHDEFVAAVEAEAARYHASACLWLPDLRERIAHRIAVGLTYVPRDKRRRDPDNLVVPLFKALCDGIVDAGIVPDDTPAYMVRSMPVIAAPDGDPRLVLTIREVLAP